MSPDPVRSLETGDLDWVLGLTRARRESLAPVAPRFWRPSADATAIHGAYLKSLITDADVVGLRTDDGYLIVQRQGPLWVVDDMVVSPDAAWPTDGVSLLRAAQDRCGRLRFVVPVVEGPDWRPRRRSASDRSSRGGTATSPLPHTSARPATPTRPSASRMRRAA